MDRRRFIARIGGLGALSVLGGAPLPLLGCGPPREEVERYTADGKGQELRPLRRSEDEWRRILGEAEFRVLREEATEEPFSSPLNEEDRAGSYICAGCFLPLFSSETKFESGTGWPSFWRPLQGRLETKRDLKLVVPRTEYHCARCGGHQGHVFDDGPPPTGQRWCNNGIALDFVPEGDELPELRG